jgi:hypothetical protein
MAGIPIIGDLLSIGSTLIDRLVPDKNKADEMKQKLIELQQNGDLKMLESLTGVDKAQAAVNQVEAANPNWFVSGWRPAIGWIGAVALAWLYVLAPIVAAISGQPLPTAGPSDLIELLFGILGIGGIRTFEKIKGCTRFK